MNKNVLTVADATELEKQTAYAEILKKQNFDYSLAVVGSHFVESMRASHYKNTATALNELIDNSIEAGATIVTHLEDGSLRSVVQDIEPNA